MKFTPEDFCSIGGNCSHTYDDDYHCDASYLARKVNIKLQAMLAEAPVVNATTAKASNRKVPRAWWLASLRWPFGSQPTHTARLVCIEPLGEE